MFMFKKEELDYTEDIEMNEIAHEVALKVVNKQNNRMKEEIVSSIETHFKTFLTNLLNDQVQAKSILLQNMDTEFYYKKGKDILTTDDIKNYEFKINQLQEDTKFINTLLRVLNT